MRPVIERVARSKSSIALALAFGGGALWLALVLNAWRDEMYTLATTGRGLTYAATRALEFEQQPPLYFVLLNVWRTLGESLFVARAFSVACAVLALVVMARLWRSLPVTTKFPLPTLFLALHPLFVWAAPLARAYAFDALMACVLLATFVRAYALSTSRRARAAHVVAAVMALHTQHHLGLLLAAMGAALVFGRSPRWKSYALDMAVVALACLPLWSQLPRNFSVHHDGSSSGGVRYAVRFERTLIEQILLPINEPFDRLLSDSRWGHRTQRWLTRLVAVALAVWSFRSHERSVADAEGRRWGRLLVLLVAAQATLYLLAAALLGPDLFVLRYLVGLVPPCVLLVATGLAWAGRRARIVGATFVGVTSAIASLVNAWPLANECDCKRVAEILASQAEPNEPVLIFPADDALPLAYHLGARNPLVPLPRAPSLEHWDMSDFALRSEDQVRGALAGRIPQSLWVMEGVFGDAVNDQGRHHLDRFVDRHYVVTRAHSLAGGVSLRHFHRRDSSPLRDPAP